MKLAAASKWTQPEEMVSLLDTKFRIEKPSAGSGMISLRDYFQYAHLQHDEDPLYIFDGYGIILLFRLLDLCIALQARLLTCIACTRLLPRNFSLPNLGRIECLVVWYKGMMIPGEVLLE